LIKVDETGRVSWLREFPGIEREFPGIEAASHGT
jgi:hypothetical protein